jgi:hypothetical protein
MKYPPNTSTQAVGLGALLGRPFRAETSSAMTDPQLGYDLREARNDMRARMQ